MKKLFSRLDLTLLIILIFAVQTCTMIQINALAGNLTDKLDFAGNYGVDYTFTAILVQSPNASGDAVMPSKIMGRQVLSIQNKSYSNCAEGGNIFKMIYDNADTAAEKYAAENGIEYTKLNPYYFILTLDTYP